MKTRAEAVDHLEKCGLHAAERDWVLGETVFVGTGGQEHHGITLYQRAMYIVSKGEMWTSLELDRPRPEDEDLVSLDEACARVARILSAPSDHPCDRCQRVETDTWAAHGVGGVQLSPDSSRSSSTIVAERTWRKFVP